MCNLPLCEHNKNIPIIGFLSCQPECAEGEDFYRSFNQRLLLKCWRLP